MDLLQTKHCKTCGRPFYHPSRKTMYCGEECKPYRTKEYRNGYYRERRLLSKKTRPCVRCGADIPPQVHGRRLYCDQCQEANYYSYQRKREPQQRPERSCEHCGGLIPNYATKNRKLCDTCKGDRKIQEARTMQNKQRKEPVKIAGWNCTRCGSDKRRQEGTAVYCGDCFWHEK